MRIRQHANETCGSALRARVARAVGARRRHHQERRGRDEVARSRVEGGQLFRNNPWQRLAPQLPQLLRRRDGVGLTLGHTSTVTTEAKFPGMGDIGSAMSGG